VNGVFLVALCLSIFLEAIQRFVEPQAVSNPRLVLIVGCFGLLSNILGLFLFHEHGHSHGGGHGHSHGSTNNLATAEEGNSPAQPSPPTSHTEAIADEGGNIADILPQTTVAGWPNSSSLAEARREGSHEYKRNSKTFNRSDEDGSTLTPSTSPLSTRKSNPLRRKRRHNSGSRSRFNSVDSIHIHPASFRNDIIAASRLEDIESQAGSESGNEQAVEDSDHEAGERSPLLPADKQNGTADHPHPNPHQPADPDNRHDSWHADHKHSQPKPTASSHHHDLNMRGVFLHVMGDALGNIGVIGSALIIWLTTSPYRFYADPLISLVITLIILGSAIPLCKAASRILLQAVPAGISVDDIKEDIQELPGIVSCHHLHVWQLSDVKLVASLHVQVEFDFKGEGSARYMQLARAVRRCLHEYGIHSSTIQPEFCLDSGHRHLASTAEDTKDDGGGGGSGSGVDAAVATVGNVRARSSKPGSGAASLRSEPEACLLECGDECDEGGQCCPNIAGSPSGDDAEPGH